MRRVSLAILSSLCACSCPGGDVCTSTGQTAETSSFSIAGEPVTIPMFLPVNCGARVPDSVTVSILGPDDKNVPFQDGGTATVDMSGFTAPVTFVPATPGAYHLAARFEPNLGLAQYDLLAAADHRHDAPAFTLPAVALMGCNHVEVTSTGWLVCIKDMEADVFGPGATTVTTSLSGTGDIAGDALWLVASSPGSPAMLTRYVATDAGFVATQTGPAGMVAAAPIVMATANDVVIAGGFNEASLFTVADGGFALQQLVVTALGTPSWRNNAVYGGLSFTSFCVQPLDGGAFASPCIMGGFSTGVSAIGVDSSGIWATEELTTTGTFVYHVDPDSSLSLKMPNGWTPRMLNALWEHGAILDGTAADGPRVLNPAIGIEIYTTGNQTLGPVCTRFAVVNDGATAHVIARQSP
jgi:hypothetical protein